MNSVSLARQVIGAARCAPASLVPMIATIQ
jgi:hypothetical protein